MPTSHSPLCTSFSRTIGMPGCASTRLPPRMWAIQRFNDRLPTATDEAYQNWREQLIDFRTRLEGIPRQGLSTDDQLNYDLFTHLVENEIAEIGFNAYRLPISRTGGFHLMFPDIFQVMPFESAQDYANYISRLEAFKQYAHENIELMRLGLRTGFIPPSCTLTDLDEQLKAHIVTDPDESVLYQPFKHFPPQISEHERQEALRRRKKSHPRFGGTRLPGAAAICGERVSTCCA